ncbi:hypothetical protein N7495_000246 [Penicillium taxi]|uniref:uncharacterized protein n=1 Tax=Penicillium taxi TaxID=168475 RepID=UPI00254549E2|nr:uncharacterized protein N7495_000246 [Penicillium taxi]KAJ5907564.1 hypothetical protein N7495_000246 [Penicillium taxi]
MALHTQPHPKQKYKYLPETTTHKATILGFPSRCSTFPALYEATCAEIIDLAGTIAFFEPVWLHVRPEDEPRAKELVAKRMASASATEKARVTLIPLPINHCWVRDTGPVYVRGEDGRRFAIDFRFCEWGNKIDQLIYTSSESEWPVMNEERQKENATFACRVLERENSVPGSNPVTRVESAVRLEGGGIELDGQGTLMATESSVLVPSRNADLSRSAVEAELHRLLGVTKFIWIPGREGLDITDCHIDAEARFIAPCVVVLCKPHPSCEAVYWDIYREARAILDTVTDAHGRRLQIYDIEEPDPELVRGQGGVVPGEEDMPAASYVNFYFTNGGLVVPAFGDAEADLRAFELLKSLVPRRVVRQVFVNALPRTGGVLHCATQQVL